VRRFVLLVHKVPVSGAFTLNDLAGGAGRMDEVARAVSTAFTLSNDLRHDTQMTVLFPAAGPVGARKITIDGGRIRYLNPDERSTAALLKNALVRSLPIDHAVEASPGMVVAPVADPLAELSGATEGGRALWLTESGADLRTATFDPSDVTAILSDPFDPTPAEEERLRSSSIPQVSVGPRSLRTSQVIDAFHNELDRRVGPPGPPTA
jgi:tRNA (pseudouridine54-N1)-methyltransferase